jgi:hypothetical protein
LPAPVNFSFFPSLICASLPPSQLNSHLSFSYSYSLVFNSSDILRST